MKDNFDSMNNRVVTRVIREDGSKETRENENVRVNNGVNWQVERLLGTTSVAAMRHMGITDSNVTPSSSDTNLVGELSSDGLSRATVTLTHTADQSLSTVSANWQYSGSGSTTIEAAAVASKITNTDSSDDTHFVMSDIDPNVNLTSNDTLEIEWGIDH